MRFKAIDILRTFTAEEVNKFNMFLSSKLLNRSAKAAKLFEALQEFYPGYESDLLTEAYIHKKISPHLKFNKSSINNLFSDLGELLENFMIMENFSGRKFERLDILREEFLRRKLYKYSERLIAHSKKLLNEVESPASSYFENSFRLNTDEINLLNVSKPKNGAEYVISVRKAFDERAMNLTGSYLKELIKIYENLQSINRTFNLKSNSKFMIDLFETMDFKKLSDYMLMNSPDGKGLQILEMYNALYKCFSDFGNEKLFEKYKKLVYENAEKIDDDEIRFHLINIVRYCMRKNDNPKNGVKFQSELFNVYKYILERGYYGSKLAKYMPNEFFRTALLQSLKLKKFSFARELIENYSHELHPDRRESMELYANALLSFHANEFEEALQKFSKIKLDHFILKFDVKNFMLMANYKLGRFDQCRMIIDTYRHTLTNDKIVSENERNRNLNFIKAISKLISMRVSNRKNDEYDLREILNNDLASREWIREESKALVKKKK